ncbi:protein arginine kinase [candidate division KSB1 bacterium]|nr:protein arginine kinase [candidate division KSB1 bacterium]
MSCWLGDYNDTSSLLDAMCRQSIPWLEGEGKENDIIISSRIRLARNLKGFKYRSQATPKSFVSILKTVLDAVGQVSEFYGYVSLNLNTCTKSEKNFLLERRLISPGFAADTIPRGVVIAPGEKVSLMINEEDHIRIQSMAPSLNLNNAWEVIRTIDNKLSGILDYSFSEQFGYLTACPTNVGTGLRASVFVHLPALTIAGKIKQIFEEMGPSEVAIRGFYGEGSRVQGDIYQVSNQLTLGRVEKNIIKRMHLVAQNLVEKEREERENASVEHRAQIEDRVVRARAIVKAAKLIQSTELLQLLSDLRLGSSLELIDPVDYRLFNFLIITTQPAHLQQIFRKQMNSTERDRIRADYVRSQLPI